MFLDLREKMNLKNKGYNKILKRKRSLLEYIRFFIFSICLVTFVISSFIIIKRLVEYRENKNVYNEMRVYSPEVKKDNESNKRGFLEEDFKKLKDINSDIKAWITIPNTEVNYPITQGINNEYYLDHNFKKEKNNGGSILIEYDNKDPFNKGNTVIHGHNMKDGSMFADLLKFKEENFFNNNNKIYITLENEVIEYEIFSIYVEELDKEHYNNQFYYNGDYIRYLNDLKSKSIFNSNVELKSDKDIITLSTCDFSIHDGRLIIHAIRNN